MKWKTKNRIINEIGNLCDKTKGRIFEVWKSIIINFSNTYNICSTLCTLNGMKARKTKYCVMLPIFGVAQYLFSIYQCYSYIKNINTELPWENFSMSLVSG